MNLSRRSLAAIALASLAGFAFAQDKYPSKPIRLIVPYPPGASTDILARSLGQKLSTNMGVPVVVDNKAGASGIIGTFLFLAYVSQTAGLKYTTASNAGFITGFSVVLVPVFSSLLLLSRSHTQTFYCFYDTMNLMFLQENFRLPH